MVSLSPAHFKNACARCFDSANTRYCGDGDTKERVSHVWEERTSGVGSKDRMHESAIQTEEMGGSILLFCCCHNVVACGHRIHWYDRTC